MSVPPDKINQLLVTPSHGHGKLLSKEASHTLPRDEKGRLRPLQPRVAPTLEQEAKARAVVRGSNRLKKITPSVIEELYRIVKSGCKPDTRVRAAQILLEHALGKPVQAVVPAQPSSGKTMTWEELLRKVRASAQGASTDGKPQGR